jgi:nucleoid-associated protein YgaU
MSIFDQIRSAFSKTDEQPAPVKGGAADPAAGDTRVGPSPGARYTVESGDTLWKIAEEAYGDGARYEEIYEANRSVLKDPDHILPGQELSIP